MIVNTRPLALSNSIKEIELKEKIDIRHTSDLNITGAR